MLISASRRTDIPAFFADWFFSRIREGCVLTQNPFHPQQVKQVDLTPLAVDGFVFWSKNPEPMLDRLSLLVDYPFYFQFTVNAYGQAIEPAVPEKEKVIESFRRLSALIGPERIIWRYDPIFISDQWTPQRHLDHFGSLASRLSGLTSQCTTSFVDVYRKNIRAMRLQGLTPPDPDQIRFLGAGLAGICSGQKMQLQTCAETVDLSDLGVGHASCVDAEKMAAISGRPTTAAKDKQQRPACGCSAGVDIGHYNTCRHGCVYCYANGSPFKDRSSRMLPNRAADTSAPASANNA
jgi:hypothetical protein